MKQEGVLMWEIFFKKSVHVKILLDYKEPPEHSNLLFKSSLNFISNLYAKIFRDMSYIFMYIGLLKTINTYSRRRICVVRGGFLTLNTYWLNAVLNCKITFWIGVSVIWCELKKVFFFVVNWRWMLVLLLFGILEN